MKTLSESPPRRGAAALRHRSVSFDLGICSADLLVLDSSQICEAARAGDVDDAYKGLHTENPTTCSIHGIAERQINEEDNSIDDDDSQWANVRLQREPQSSGYGYGKGFYRANITTLCKENNVRFPRKRSSSPIAIARQQHSGLIRPHSGPFSGPLTPLKMQSFGAKLNRAPSIIPATLLRRRVLGFNVCEPMSPEVTCLGRIRSKKFNSISVRDMMDGAGQSVESQAVEKGRCFDAKNRLCGKRSKGRKKKEKGRRRFASAESKGTSLEHAQTRREKAATLARSLTDLLEDMRRVEKASAHYVPSVPPPNSLLLMRGCRIGKEDMDMDMDMGIEHGIEENTDMGPQGEPSVPPPNSLLLMRGCKNRGNLSLPVELLTDRVSSKHVQGSEALNTNSNTYHVKKLKARAARHRSLLDLIDNEEGIACEGVSTSQVRDSDTVQRSNVIATGTEKSAGVENLEKVSKFIEAKLTQKSHRRATLCQRRSFGELPFIEVKRCTRTVR